MIHTRHNEGDRMKKFVILAALILSSYGLVVTIADTTFSWSQGGQTGTLTYTDLGLVSPVITGTPTIGGATPVTTSNAAQSDTNTTTTATGYTPAFVGQILVGGAGAGTNAIWIAKGTTTNDWVLVEP